MSAATLCLSTLFAGLSLVTPQENSTTPESVVLVLEGVIVSKDPARSVALVRRDDAGRARSLRIGQAYGGYVLVDVSRDSVLLRGTNGDVRLALGGPAGGEPVPPRPVAWVRRAFPRAEARERLEREIPVILEETRLTPRVEDGEVRGLALERVPDGTLIAETGLLPGDVLLSLNGVALYSLTELWGLLARLSDADELRLVVDRGGEELRLAYALTR